MKKKTDILLDLCITYSITGFVIFQWWVLHQLVGPHWVWWDGWQDKALLVCCILMFICANLFGIFGELPRRHGGRG